MCSFRVLPTGCCPDLDRFKHIFGMFFRAVGVISPQFRYFSSCWIDWLRAGGERVKGGLGDLAEHPYAVSEG